MAITDTFPAAEAEILVNEVALQEYDDDDGQPAPANTVAKYIEAVSGAEFAIRYKIDQKPKYDVTLEIFMDDQWVAGRTIELKNYDSHNRHTIAGVSSNKNGNWSLSKFTFSDLNIVDSTSRLTADRLMKDLKGLGQIKLNFHYVVNVRTSSRPLPGAHEGTRLDEIPEKALKGRALSHQATLRRAVPTQAVSVVEVDFLDPRKRPFASVSFKYRSRDALKALLVIPRSPSPVPLEERDLDDLSSQEMRELLQRQREREAVARIVKQERGIKRERSRERSHTVGALSGDADDVAFVSTKRARLPVTLNEDGVETIDLT